MKNKHINTEIYNLRLKIIEMSKSLPILENDIEQKNLESLQNAMAYILTVVNNEIVQTPNNFIHDFAPKGLFVDY